MDDSGAGAALKIMLGIIGILGSVVVAILASILNYQKKGAPTAPSAVAPWEQDRGEYTTRLETVESEVRGLRRERHDESARIQSIMGKLELLKLEDQHICERVERLEDRKP